MSDRRCHAQDPRAPAPAGVPPPAPAELLPPPFAISAEQAGGTVRIRVWGEVDIDTAPRLLELAARERAEGASRILLDLAGVSFIDSTGVRAVIQAHQQLGERLRIVASEPCRRVMAIIGMIDRLPIIDGDGRR